MLILIYFSAGAMLLPMGDFAMLRDIPEMYRHCKMTEHHDMNPFDFITDHLLNIDGLFDRHDHGDEQRPHQPLPVHHHQVQPVYALATPLWPKTVFPMSSHHPVGLPVTCMPSGYHPDIFRPPII